MGIRIDDVMKSSTGKSWRVKSGNQWYGADLDSGVELMKGQTISASVKTSKAGPWLTGISPEAPSAPTQVAGPIPATYGQNAPAGVHAAPYWQTFVSNQVASAIQAGLIKEPQQLKEWTFAAMNAIKGAVEGDIEF